MSQQIQHTDQKIAAFRIERISAWIQEREAFVLSADGSGFYERYSAFDENGKYQRNVIQRVNFRPGGATFDAAFSHIDGLQRYFGDDVSRADFARHSKYLKLKPAFPCGDRATDNDSFVIYWNTTSSENVGDESDLSGVFVTDGGCRSPEAVAVWNRIKSAVKLFEDVVPVSERTVPK